jgi:focal adhesion kinase 1
MGSISSHSSGGSSKRDVIGISVVGVGNRQHQNFPSSAIGGVDDYAEIVDEEGDYSSPSRDFEIDRSRVIITMPDVILGEGQFGNVHKGVYAEEEGVQGVAIAVKTCKVEGDDAMTEKFLGEACKL